MLVFLNDLQTGVCGATASADADQLRVLAEPGTGGFSIEGQVLQTSSRNLCIVHVSVLGFFYMLQ